MCADEVSHTWLKMTDAELNSATGMQMLQW